MPGFASRLASLRVAYFALARVCVCVWCATVSRKRVASRDVPRARVALGADDDDGDDDGRAPAIARPAARRRQRRQRRDASSRSCHRVRGRAGAAARRQRTIALRGVGLAGERTRRSCGCARTPGRACAHWAACDAGRPAMPGIQYPDTMEQVRAALRGSAAARRDRSRTARANSSAWWRPAHARHSEAGASISARSLSTGVRRAVRLRPSPSSARSTMPSGRARQANVGGAPPPTRAWLAQGTPVDGARPRTTGDDGKRGPYRADDRGRPRTELPRTARRVITSPLNAASRGRRGEGRANYRLSSSRSISRPWRCAAPTRSCAVLASRARARLGSWRRANPPVQLDGARWIEAAVNVALQRAQEDRPLERGKRDAAGRREDDRPAPFRVTPSLLATLVRQCRGRGTMMQPSAARPPCPHLQPLLTVQRHDRQRSTPLEAAHTPSPTPRAARHHGAWPNARSAVRRKLRAHVGHDGDDGGRRA